ncbi:YhgE/Pip domain-containing protein [Bifidobacterium callitrichidarum]|uniref:YhgE/Pip domain-containing protein n=1 Tax=Bifidobacterium callitrichidarum TaxID=2052941 RepID=A0A2U2NA13_9BIFI|nr:YhgE/Pip domain-containing protein [Bifidobacterium callitrichidarum]PWG65948.1 YhgE/Pip domain-containing protein [Bifidobacterium callitrichidarum]
MRTIWRIFRRDFLRILRNPVAVVVTLGVAVIPSLYAWFNILANWDPYSATGNIQVAVANADRGTSNDLVGRLNAGKQVVAQLKKNHQLGWRFVDNEDQAVHGVETGEYYAAIVLPKDFSESLVNSVTGTTERPKIRYYVNEKKNAIAPKITDTGASTIDEQINSTFVTTVGDTVAKAVSKAGGELSKAAGSTQQDAIADLDTVLDTIGSVQTALTDLTDTLDQADGTIADAKNTTGTLKRAIASARKASQQSGTLLTEAQNGSQAFSTTLTGALDSSSAKLSGLAVDVNTAAGTIIGSFNSAQDSVDSITNALNAPLDRTQTAIDNVRDALKQAGIDENTSDPLGQRIWNQLDTLDGVIGRQQSQINDFHKNATQFIDSGKDATGHLSGAMGTAATGGLAALSQARQSLTGTVMPNLNASLNSFAALNGTLDGTLVSLNGTIEQADGLFDQLSDTIGQTRTTISGTQQSMAQLAEDVRTVRTDIGALDSSAAYRKIMDALHLDDEEFGKFMGTPVNLVTKVVYPTDNYGSAVTPFYTNLALWVGGFVLIAIYKLEVDRENLRHVTAAQAYLGRWLLLVTVGFLQAIIATIGDLVLGIQCEHPLLFVLAGVFCSFVYINIIYALAVAFRHIGKAVAVILVIVQIPGASGLYPIEMMPEFFRDLHPWLPFTYGINAMRGPIAGTYANHYWLDMMHLAYYLPVALFVGLVVRRYAMNLNALFDRRLGDTDLMITEHNSMVNEQVSLNAVFRTVSDSKELRAIITRRAHRFFARYPMMIVSGLVLLTVLPFVFLILLFVMKAKIAMLSAWILSIIIIDAYLIVTEYMRESYAMQLGVSAMSADEFRDVMLNGYVWRRFRGADGKHAAGAGHMPEHAARFGDDAGDDADPDIGETTRRFMAIPPNGDDDGGSDGKGGTGSTDSTDKGGAR